MVDDLSGSPLTCALRDEDGALCPSDYECTAVAGSTQAVCCLKVTEETEGSYNSFNIATVYLESLVSDAVTEESTSTDEERPQTSK